MLGKMLHKPEAQFKIFIKKYIILRFTLHINMRNLSSKIGRAEIMLSSKTRGCYYSTPLNTILNFFNNYFNSTDKPHTTLF